MKTRRKQRLPMEHNHSDIAGVKVKRALHRAFLAWYAANLAELPFRLLRKQRSRHWM